MQQKIQVRPIELATRGATFLILAMLPAPAAGQGMPCVGGTVDGYPCDNVRLMARLSETDLQTSAVTDNWGWTDSMTSIEYAILCATEGTIFVSLEDPENPVVVGIRFILRAKELGFSLREIAELLALRVDPGTPCREIRRRTEDKLRDVEAKMESLQRMRQALEKLAASCHGGGPIGDCPILEALDAP